MPLKSRLFQGDKRLEACLTQDPQHVTVGCEGDYVSRIQSAVMTLGELAIDGAELRDGYYGPSTARAVLDYKQRRGIINFTYQRSADSIVGKMTMARLDFEMSMIEMRDTAARIPV